MENSNATEILLADDGKVFRRTVATREVVINEEAVFAAFKEKQRIILPNIMTTVGKYPTSIRINTDKTRNTSIVGTIQLSELCFNSPFRVKDGIATPLFIPAGEYDGPVLNVTWDPAIACNGNVKLWFMVQVAKPSEGTVYGILECFLCITSTSNRMYRMPMANVYADGRVCMGNFDRTSPFLSGALNAAVRQLMASPWNADLKSLPEKTEAFFRFKITNEGTETMPVDGRWPNLCDRIACTALEELILPEPGAGEE